MFVNDTPGTGSRKEKFKHKVLQKHALTAAPINVVFFLIEYEARTAKMLTKYEELLEPFKKKGYQKMARVIVTKFDACPSEI